MARPRSEDKRQMILQSATKLFAEEGLNAPTVKIAKLAKVAEGTIFTYFTNKDELLNQLYIELKSQLRASALSSNQQTTLKEKIWYAWHAYISWAINNPEGHQVIAKLSLSSRITPETHKQIQQSFCEITNLLDQAFSSTSSKYQSVEFAGAMMGAIADVTVNFIKGNQSNAEKISYDGFSTFWRAITGE